MKVTETPIDGVRIIDPDIFGDHRGYFFESYNHQRYFPVCGCQFVQDNQSRSSYGVVRGLHFQRPPFAQAKLVSVVQGRVLDVAVDIRQSSPTYGQHVAVELSADTHRQLFLPQGMAHGFAVLSDEAVFQYKCDNVYHPEAEGAIAWNDPTLGIDWHLPPQVVIVSQKDSRHPLFSNFISPFK